MATIRDVARAAGVSVTTVSATINDSAPVSAALRARVLAAIEEVGYSPDPVARHLRSGRSRIVGLMVPDIASPYASTVAKELQRALSERGYGMFFASNDDDPDRERADIARMADHRVAGLAIVPTSLGPDYGARLAAAIKQPAVLLDRVVPDTPFDCFSDDNALGARLLVHHLAQLGHRDLAMIGGRTGISSSDERIAGVRAAAADAGLSLPDDRVLTHHQREEHAIRAVQDLMTRPAPPSAILTINAAQTRGVMKGLRSMGRSAPEDVSVATFDRFHNSEGFRPEITSLEQDITGISAAAAQCLIGRLEQGPEPEPVPHVPVLRRFAPSLRVRSSCRAV